mmetsp:Transcript_92415/g.287550  ORF Transcript_92415/g.287550 Transcript_92415/m.287550 type:complete len:127 (-) Transcript_92415:22-402(-)
MPAPASARAAAAIAAAMRVPLSWCVRLAPVACAVAAAGPKAALAMREAAGAGTTRMKAPGAACPQPRPMFAPLRSWLGTKQAIVANTSNNMPWLEYAAARTPAERLRVAMARWQSRAGTVGHDSVP